jgi:hypothetical protein
MTSAALVVRYADHTSANCYRAECEREAQNA